MWLYQPTLQQEGGGAHTEGLELRREMMSLVREDKCGQRGAHQSGSPRPGATEWMPPVGLKHPGNNRSCNWASGGNSQGEGHFESSSGVQSQDKGCPE